MKVQADQVAAFRLARHHFVGPANLSAVCENVCGIQAQVMSAAQVALWARMHQLKRDDIQVALWRDRALVRTSCMRQTLHLLTAKDFPMYIAALRRSRVGAIWRIMSKFGVTQREADALNDDVVEALAAGPLTKRQLTGHIAPKVGKHVQAWMERFWNVFRLAVVEGLICYGPVDGQQDTMVRVDHWLPKQKRISEQDAQQLLLRRYLRAYGPATLQDFARWAGFPMPEAKAAWTLFQDELCEVDVEGQKGFVLREDLGILKNSASGGHILRLAPSFDPYLLGHVNKNHLLDPVHYKRVYRSSAWISPVVLLNGRVAGIWSSQRRGKQVLLEIEPLANFSKSMKALLAVEAASLGEFLSLSPVVNFKSEPTRRVVD
jgi:uncharacterized protein YcaQ